MRDYSHLIDRPEPTERLFVSEAVEDAIADTSKKIADPILKRIFRQTTPNTLDTATYHVTRDDGQPDTYIATGDIPAMWPRDTYRQVKLYIPFAREDENLRQMIAGVIYRLTKCIQMDPYANAFRHPHMKDAPKNKRWGPGKKWHEGVWERKYELDSLLAYIQLIVDYVNETGDMSVITKEVVGTLEDALSVIRTEQGDVTKDRDKRMYRAIRPSGFPMPKFVRSWGKGPRNNEVGLSRCLYRPSDDEVERPYLIPANAMAVVALNGMSKVLPSVMQRDLAIQFEVLAQEIDDAIWHHGTVDHPKYGKIFAYETDGFGNHNLMDDPNIPSLLSLPYMKYISSENEVYQNTKRFILSEDNRFYAKGLYEGMSSPHVDPDYIWHLGILTEIMVSDDDEQITNRLKVLTETTAGTGFMHESFHKNNPYQFTRPWFCWANSMCGEMIFDLAKRKPWLLDDEIK